jgi:hypothetical protein
MVCWCTCLTSGCRKEKRGAKAAARENETKKEVDMEKGTIKAMVMIEIMITAMIIMATVMTMVLAHGMTGEAASKRSGQRSFLFQLARMHLAGRQKGTVDMRTPPRKGSANSIRTSAAALLHHSGIALRAEESAA